MKSTTASLLKYAAVLLLCVALLMCAVSCKGKETGKTSDDTSGEATTEPPTDATTGGNKKPETTDEPLEPIEHGGALSDDDYMKIGWDEMK